MAEINNQQTSVTKSGICDRETTTILAFYGITWLKCRV